MRYALMPFAAALTLVGCPVPSSPPGDAGTDAGTDAGQSDSGEVDGGPRDSGAGGGSADGGAVDAGRSWHVSPSGKPTGQGTRSDPWDLPTALAGHPSILPGDTVWLHGGVYPGPVTSSLTGAPGARILVRQAEGERATIADNRKQADGATVQLNGAWATYWGFEVVNNNPDRVVPVGSTPRFRPMGLQVQGPNLQLVNLVIHDTGIAVGFWKEAFDSELYGCLIYNNGTQNTLTEMSAGHGVYAQNNQGVKTVRDNFFLNAFGFGVHVFPNPGNLVGFNIEGNVVAEPGVLSDANTRFNALLVSPYGVYPADRITVADNMTFHGIDTAPASKGVYANSCFNCIDFGTAGTLELRNNFLVGGFAVLALARWADVRVTGNTVIGSSVLVSFGRHSTPTRNEWSNNRYFGGLAQAFGVDNTLSAFTAWKTALGSDSTSVHQAALPTGAQTFLRPNVYDSRRAMLVVYNWDRGATVPVDVSSFLAAGERYELRNAADWFGAPLMSGTYTGGDLGVPMTGLTVAAPVGWPAPANTAPRFAAFVLMKSGP